MKLEHLLPVAQNAAVNDEPAEYGLAGRQDRSPTRRGGSCRRPAPILLAAAFALRVASSAAGAEIEYQHGISLLHDLKYGSDFQHFEYANPDAPKGGTLVLSTNMHVSNFSGQPGSEVPNAPGLGRTAERLLIRTGDELSGLYGWLADGVALSRDRKSLHIRLHPQARWHDGVPVTSRDVKFSFDETLALVFGRVYFEPWLESLDVINPRELAVRHRRTFTNANLVALTWFRIRPAHYWAGRDPRSATLDPPLGSGPYRIADFDRHYVRYERVEDYWGRDIPVNRGRFNFDTIRYDVYRDATVARESLRKGLFDLYFETDIRHWTSSYAVPAVRTGRLLRDTRQVRKFIGPQVAIALNTDHHKLRDVRVREALTLALDFEWQNRVFHHSSQVRAMSYFANSPFAATGLPTTAELELLEPFRGRIPERVFTEPFELPISTGSGQDRSALARARTLFAEAGWQVVDGRLVNAAGEPFVFELLTQNPSNQRILLPYIESLELLGVEVRLRVMDNVATVNLLRERQFEAYVRSHEVLNPPIGELHSHFASSTADMPGGGNLAGIRNPVIDALIEKAVQGDSIEEVASACRALDRVLLWGFYHVMLNVPHEERFLYWDKFGRPEHEDVARYEYLTQSSLRVLDGWWYDPAKARRLVGDSP